MKPTKIPTLNERISHKLVPIYSTRFLLVVTNNVMASRSARNHIYGQFEEQCAGLCSWDNGFRVGVFLERGELCHSLIAHELFHATHRILESAGVVFGINNHEPFAIVNGWLTAHVYRELDRMGEKVGGGYRKRIYLKKEPGLTGPHLDE